MVFTLAIFRLFFVALQVYARFLSSIYTSTHSLYIYVGKCFGVSQ